MCTVSPITIARLRIKGKLIWRSLKTDVLSVAKLRLSDFEKTERQGAENRDAVAAGRVAIADAIAIHKSRMDGNVSLKPRTKEYHDQRIKALLKSWPSFEDRELRSVTKAECLDWAAKFGVNRSSTAFNHTISILRKLFEIGMEMGARYDNPAQFIKRTRERPKQLTLPDPKMFWQFIAEVEKGGSRDSQNCANLIRFLAFGGFRKSEAANITWADCDFDKEEIIVRGDPETGTKNWSIRRVPMIPEMINLLDRLKRKKPEAIPSELVMSVRECQKAMDRAAKAVKMKRITHHDLRHLFATMSIESGVDIPTVSRWLGHKDGGALV